MSYQPLLMLSPWVGLRQVNAINISWALTLWVVLMSILHSFLWRSFLDGLLEKFLKAENSHCHCLSQVSARCFKRIIILMSTLIMEEMRPFTPMAENSGCIDLGSVLPFFLSSRILILWGATMYSAKKKKSISQLPLWLEMAIWHSLGQWDISRNHWVISRKLP